MPVPGSTAENSPPPEGGPRTCDLCGSRRFETLGRRDRHGRPLETVICWRCGLVQHAVVPSDEELAHFYEQEYRVAYNGESTPSPRRVVREWERGRRRFQKIRPFLRPADEVFEIGAGIGCNLKHFELAGHAVAGVEPGAGFCQFSRDVLRCPVRQGVWQQLPSAPQCDLILLVHVLEHLNSPTRALRQFRSMLRAGGRLFVEVPNLASPHAAPKKLFHYAHIYNFTPWSLAQLAETCGFQVTQVLSTEREKNLSMMLTRTEAFSRNIDPQSYLKTAASLRSFHTLNYYLRPGYLVERVREMIDLIGERRSTEARYREIVAACEQSAAARSTPSDLPPPRRAA